MTKSIYCPKCGSHKLEVLTTVKVTFDYSDCTHPNDGQMEEYGNWDTPQDHAHTECSKCGHEGRLLEFMREAPFSAPPLKPPTMIVLGGSAYSMNGDSLMTAPVYADGRVPAVGGDEWAEVDRSELSDPKCKRAMAALLTLHSLQS